MTFTVTNTNGQRLRTARQFTLVSNATAAARWRDQPDPVRHAGCGAHAIIPSRGFDKLVKHSAE